MDLSTATPVEIDTALAALYRVETRLMADVETQGRYLRDHAHIRLASEQPSRFDREPKTVGGNEDALLALQAIVAEGNPASAYSKAAEAKRRIDAYQAAVDALAANRAEQAPLNAEYRRRGGWTRSFMVLNSNGHAHRDMSCSTCFWNTRYGWLVDLSGSTEEQVVEAVGSDACTVCYPTAPVVKRARTTFAAEEKEAQAAREEKARLKAERDAAKAAKAITNPDGTPLRGKWGVIATEVTAQSEYVTAAADAAAWAKRPDLIAEYAETAETILAALAHKRGTTIEAQREALAPKVAKKIKSYGR